jgi:thiol-disulfide isomerase/thioredoxin
MNFPARYILGTLLIISSFSVFSQTKNVMIMDEKINKNVMIGYCDRSGLEEGVFGTYFTSQYDLYAPKESVIKKLTEVINKVQITIVYGTWCSDSRLQLGRFYKILDETGYKEKNLTVIGVNRDKNAISVNIENLNIKLVPTFIIYQKGKELGRIVESPKKSLEEDLWKIVKKVK